MIHIPDRALLSGTERKLVTEIAEALAEISSVNAVILFGSRMGGNPKPYSDIDLCVITTKPPLREDKEEIGAYTTPLVDLSFFDELPLLIRFRVLQNGAALFVKDEMQLHRLQVDTLKKYHDFEPVLHRAAMRAMGAPDR